MQRIGLRAAGRLAGCDHAHIARLAASGRLRRGEDGLFDPEDVKAVMAQADPGLVRKPPSKGGDEVVTELVKSPARRRSPRRPVTTLPPANADALWAALGYLAALVPWAVACHGGGLQLAFDVHADLALDLPAELRRRGFAQPGALQPVNWLGLAAEFGLEPADPAALAAEYARRRAEG